MHNRETEFKEDSVVVIKIDNFKIRDSDESTEGLDIPQHFFNGGFFIAVKHLSEDSKPLYRVFFNKITGKTTKNSFFREVGSSEVSGLFLDPTNGEQYIWEADIEEFDFTKVSDYDVTEKALYFMSDIMLMDIKEFKKLSGEDKTTIDIRYPDGEEVFPDGDSNVDMAKFMLLDETIMNIQKHILDALDGKYYDGDSNPADAMMWSNSSGKSVNIFNAFKYLTRYMNDDGDKSNNEKDLIKATHYIIVELARRLKFNIKNE